MVVRDRRGRSCPGGGPVETILFPPFVMIGDNEVGPDLGFFILIDGQGFVGCESYCAGLVGEFPSRRGVLEEQYPAFVVLIVM
jgi:hypothetical protein